MPTTVETKRPPRACITWPIILVVALIGAACGGSQPVNGSDSSDGRTAHDGVVDAPTDAAFETIQGATLAPTQDGRLGFGGPTEGLEVGLWFTLEPERWPRNLTRPVVGVGRIIASNDELEAVIWAVRQSAGIEHLVVVPSSSQPMLEESKLTLAVDSVDGTRIRLSGGDTLGVNSGDIYFVTRELPGAQRVGEHVVALARVVEVHESHAIARVDHARQDVRPTDVALFAQASLDRPALPATVLIAPFSTEQWSDTNGGLPEIAHALPMYLARYGITNIGVDTLDAYIDPRPHDAPRTASELGPDGSYGVIVFGDRSENTFIYNTTTFGNAPHPANTVGILPGGLPLPVDDALVGLSAQLAPSFIASALALRGDHALSIYFLESVLEDVELEDSVRFHLREHLALRYYSLGRNSEAVGLMNTDIEEARRTDDVYALLNALSIRAYLDSETGLLEQWIDDTTEFLDVAEGTLPSDALGFERLAQARALGASQRTAEATEVLQSVIQFAREHDDDALHLYALVQLCAIHARARDVAALVVLAEVEQLAGDITPAEQVSIHLFSSEVYLLFDDRPRSNHHVEHALMMSELVESAPSRATVYRRAADLLLGLERLDDAWQVLQQAGVYMIESAQYAEAAQVISELAFVQIRHAGSLGPAGYPLLAEGHGNLMLSGELSLRLGNTLEAARTFFLIGALELRTGNAVSADRYLERAQDLARRSAHFETLFSIADERAQIAAMQGNLTRAVAFINEARLWSDVGALSLEPSALPSPEL